MATPDRVAALLLVDSGPGFKKQKSLEAWQAQVERTASFLEQRGPRAFVDGRASGTCVGLYPDRTAARAAGDAIAAQNPAGLAHFARQVAGKADPVLDRLAEIRQPTLVLVGEQDAAYQAAGEVMAKRIEGAVHRVLPRAGHISNLDEPAAWNAVVLDFLTKLPGRPSGDA